MGSMVGGRGWRGLAVLLLGTSACAGSSAEVKRAKEVAYQTDYDTVWAAALDTVEASYKIHGHDKQGGWIETDWQKVERTVDDSGYVGAFFFRARVVVRGGPPWTVFVDGIAGEYRPALALIYEFKHGDGDEPPWVQGRIDALYLEVYKRLQASAVTSAKPASGGPPPAAPPPSAGPEATKPGVTVEEEYVMNIRVPDPACVKRGGLPGCVKECDAKTAASCTTVGFFERDEATRRRFFTLGCDLGDPDGCFHLGSSFMHGQSRDEVRAVTLLTKACDAGHAGACGGLASAFAGGRGVAKDDRRAFALFEKACSGGDPNACVNLGHRFENGQGVAKDAVKARALFEQACQVGGIGLDGCVELARLLKAGEGGPKDEARAKELLERACRGGFQRACE